MFSGKRVVGLDIGSSKVKAIQLKRTGNKLEIERFGVADVYPGGDRTASQAPPFELKKAAARQALENGKINAKYAVSGVAGETIIVRYIQLPEMPVAELKTALRWEAEEYIPYPIDEVNLDSVVLGPSATPGKVDVLLVCARKDLINEHVQIIRDIGLTPAIVDCESFAFLNTFEELYRPDAKACVALVNVGAETTNINIYINGTSRFSRDIGIAGNQITMAVANKTGLPYGRAEQLKQTVGVAQQEQKEDGQGEESTLISTIRGSVERITGSDLGDDTVEAAAAKATHDSLEQLVSEVRRSIQFFENQAGGATVSRLYLGGGTAKMPNIVPFLSAALELPVEIVDPLRFVSISRDVNRPQAEAHREQMAVSIGLALRGLTND
jgi:type IV pilus assembly protein PilM